MRLSTSTALAAAAALNANAVVADAASYCAQGSPNVCFQWGVPEASAKAGSGDVFFQINAPTSLQWVGLGIGQQMVGSSMFIIYQDGKGNITLSTRPGKNHVMPTYSARSDVELLAGSGVDGNNMIANIKCSECSNLNLNGNTNWISAWKSGRSLATTDPSATINEHDDHDQFSVDLTKASISSDSNPFSGSSSDNGGSSGGNGGDSGGSNGNGNGNTPGGAVTSKGSSGPSTNTLISAHGILMSIVFVALYPIGAILMPLLGKWYLHAAWQVIAFLGMWAAFAIGYVAAHRLDIFFDQSHTRLGIFVVCLISLQPIFGWMHHANYLKTQSRGLWSHIHIWYGRALMILGIINGGLGLQLVAEANRYIIAFSVVAGIVALLYLGTIAFGLTKSNGKQLKHVESPVMTEQ